MRELPPALVPMGNYRQFIVYLTQPSSTRRGKTDKLPADFRTGRVVSAHESVYWTDSETAIASATILGNSYGVGFVFTESDPFWFIDIDDCLLSDGSDWSPVAKALCGAFAGAAVEISRSGRGLHIFGCGIPPAHSCKNDAAHIEFYHSGRFVALTGTGALGDAGIDFTHQLADVVEQYFPPDSSQISEQCWTECAVDEWRGPSSDDDLIRRAMNSRSTSAAFEGRASFADLWTGNTDALARAYPDPARIYDSSSADAALAQHLAFWTGKNCTRIDSLMRKSALAREKWAREDYLPRTILGAVCRQFEVLIDKTIEPVTGVTIGSIESPTPILVTGSTFINNDMQLQLFAGCVYIQDQHRILVPGGATLKPDQFKVHFGGYVFTMDTANEKTTKDAWDAFTQNQSYRCPRVNSVCFRPNMPHGAVIHRDGQTFVNTYWPVDVPRKVGDCSPFLNHLAKILPDDRDRFIMLCYMAACVQHKGVKFQWAPLLQGVEGNGKTLFTRCVAEALGRRYVHWPKASKLAAQFNSWMIGKLFYGVEDIYVPDQKREIIEELKPMITGGDGLEIEGKGVDQINGEICGNFMFNSNHKDAILKTKNDRRFCPLFSAQQQFDDLARDGMDGDYFHKLYQWLRADGYAIVSELLHTFTIPDEYNPATNCQRAPVTTATSAAISASTSGVEQEVLEAIAQGLPGFCGGWISSIQLERLLERIGVVRRITHNRRKEILNELGYIHHPALVDGRVNNLVLPDGGKPRLFVKSGSPASIIQRAADAAKSYEQSNNHFNSPTDTYR